MRRLVGVGARATALALAGAGVAADFSLQWSCRGSTTVFCMTAIDAAGNASPRSRARLTIG